MGGRPYRNRMHKGAGYTSEGTHGVALAAQDTEARTLFGITLTRSRAIAAAAGPGRSLRDLFNELNESPVMTREHLALLAAAAFDHIISNEPAPASDDDLPAGIVLVDATTPDTMYAIKVDATVERVRQVVGGLSDLAHAGEQTIVHNLDRHGAIEMYDYLVAEGFTIVGAQ